MECALGSVQCALCSVQCALCSVQCALCSLQFALCSVQCALCSVQCVLNWRQFPVTFTPIYCVQPTVFQCTELSVQAIGLLGFYTISSHPTVSLTRGLDTAQDFYI